MGRRPAHPRFKRTRDTHDPQTSIPTALKEELSLSKSADPSPSRTIPTRKEQRKRKRREKRHAGHQATLQWRARRLKSNVAQQQVSVPQLDNPTAAEQLKQLPIRLAPKRKRKASVQHPQHDKVSTSKKDSQPQSGQAESWDDPDASEARRLEKLLGISRKKKRKTARGDSFAYSDAFGDDEDLIDLLNFCDRTVSQSKLSGPDSDQAYHQSNAHLDEDSDGRVEQPHSTRQLADQVECGEGKDYDKASDDDVSPGDLSSTESSDGNMSHVLKNTNVSSGVEGKAIDAMNSTRSARKYVPPSSRGQANAKTAVTRRMRGLLNRVADANASGIADSIVQLFNDRGKNLALQEIANIYANGTLDSVRDGAGLGYISPYLRSHAAIGSHIAHRVDDLVLATLVVSAVRRFHSELRTIEADSEILKENGNQSDAFGYAALIGALYERRAVSCDMVYELVRAIAELLSSERLGLLLALLRQVGPLLRFDDPTALKDMIEFVHIQAEKLTDCMGEGAEEEVNPKLQIMLDLIDDIKNNKLKRSTLEEVKARYAWAGGPERPLSASLRDLLDDNFTSGRWWAEDRSDDTSDVEREGRGDDSERKVRSHVKGRHENDLNLNGLASALRLSAGRRRDLFKVIVGSANVSEAYERLEEISAFDSKKHYDRDTAIVILHCCGSESMFNPFYAYLAERMCKRARRSRFTFEFACWDIFKSIPGSTKTKPMSKRRARNFGHLLAHLWHCGALSLSVLRYVPDFEDCGEQEASFYASAIEVLFAQLVKDNELEATAPFEKLLSEKWDGIDAFRVSLAFFLRRSVHPRLDKHAVKLLNKAVHVLEDGNEI